MKTRTLDIPDNALVLYTLHLMTAWAGVLVATFFLGAFLPRTLSNLFGAPGAAPFFPGVVGLGLWAGFVAIRRLPTIAACFVFLPPLAWVLWTAYITVFVFQPPYGGWPYYWMINWSNHCGANECMNAQFITAPFIGAAAYSIAALIGIFHTRSKSAAASQA